MTDPNNGDTDDDEPMTPERIQTAWQEMIKDGTLVPTGEYRPDRNGVMQPVYVLKEFLKGAGN